jgi:Mrp family chromosome partitioning ATPase
MTDTWLRPIETVALALMERKLRIIGVASPESNSGVTLTTHRLGETLGRSGLKTLVVDLTRTEVDRSTVALWVPGGAPGSQRVGRPTEAGFDIIYGVPTPTSRYAFNNVERLRQSITDDFAEYDYVLFDLPPIPVQGTETINPVAAAAVCDGVVLVVVTGRVTSPRVRRTVDAIKASGGRLIGTIMNDVASPTLGVQIALATRRLKKFAPKFAARIEQRALSSAFFN